MSEPAVVAWKTAFPPAGLRARIRVFQIRNRSKRDAEGLHRPIRSFDGDAIRHRPADGMTGLGVRFNADDSAKSHEEAAGAC